jgi:hypothetical protein
MERKCEQAHIFRDCNVPDIPPGFGFNKPFTRVYAALDGYAIMAQWRSPND